MATFQSDILVRVDALTKSNENIDFKQKTLELNQADFVQRQTIFEKQLSTRKVECDQMMRKFHSLEADTVKLAKFNPEMDTLTNTIKKLATENVAQQFELNTINNFIEKYQPIRIQHHLSSIMRQTLTGVDDFDTMFARFEEAESAMFEELHQILLMDGGRADIAATIENMNMNIAKA